MRPPSSNVNFFGFSTLIFVLAAASIATAWSPLRSGLQAASRDQAVQFVSAAASAPPQEAVTDYRLATWLDPHNRDAFLGLARTLIKAGHSESALAALEEAGQGSEAAELRVRTLIELGRSAEAANRATDVAHAGASDADLLLAALAYALSGRSTDITPLIPLTSSPEAAGRLARAQAGNVSLAGELYASGLPESSRALLVKQPTSFERNLLLGHIYFDRGTPADLSTATDYLTNAAALNPSNLEVHQLLATVYTDRGLIAESSAQALLAQKLISARP
ncbi:MAG TPA: hypothetical protein VHQ86_04475 [Candidatus Saccharimonadia bacterium]|nr:hypothetical protein [Candidatus Saccharimonadia bacterium]